MRITGGALRGRRLATRSGRATRPTSGRVREAVFNLLRGRIEGARVLDLFAGSGALGIEALSRGATLVLFVDSSASARGVIRENLEALGLRKRGRIIGGAANRVIASLAESGRRFDVVFVDPPYGEGTAQEILRTLSSRALLASGGVVVIECGKRESVNDSEEGLRLTSSKLYGDTRILLFESRSRPAGESLEPQQGGSG
jgi:16S rRNA (guanine966-N2)-methyltransferase